MTIYNSTDKTQITAHFNISEFKCKCGGNHSTKLDSDLLSKLEKLHSALECSKIIINSGYRCPTHDRNVGGNGSGQHTKGNAADIVCYDSKNRIISSKIVCCAAQDIGFNGIANIDNSYTATHVDVRGGSLKWFGNEALGSAGTNYSITSDFYKHFGLTKNDVYPNSSKSETKSIKLIIDGITYEGTVTAK